MRVSNTLIQQRILRELQTGLAALNQASSQVSTGKRFERLSEDPLAGTQVMGTDRALRGIEQYRRNSIAVRARTDAEEAVLNQLTDLLTRAKELAIQEGTATSTPQTRIAVKAEVDRLLEQAIQLGNAQVGNEYIFGGHQTTSPPFDPSGTYFGDSGLRKAEIGQDYLITTTQNGQGLLVDSGVLAALKALSQELGTGTSATVGPTASLLDAAFNQVQTMLATNGARVRQVESAMQNADALEQNLSIRKEDLQGLSLEEATTRLAATQTALQAALLATSRMLNTSLVDYLR